MYVTITDAENRQLEKVKSDTGVPIGRLVADAIRVQILNPKEKAS